MSNQQYTCKYLQSFPFSLEWQRRKLTLCCCISLLTVQTRCSILTERLVQDNSALKMIELIAPQEFLISIFLSLW